MIYNKILLITGASSGIGLSTAIEAQNKGFTVIFTSRNIESNQSLNEKLTNGSVLKNLDVSDEKSVKNLFEFIKVKFGKLDALINCAGFVDPETMLATTLENWNATISINLTGTFLCCKYATGFMKKSGGTIVNVASTAGLTPRPGWGAYAASKSGVIGFSASISEELSEYNIRVFVICPGRTATPLRKILAPTEDPLTIMQPETVSTTILFCLTEEASPLEGQPILVRERF
ncbi:Short chain dehydrogenase family protein [Flavobacterium sp. 9R]|uniref:SDR family oxidoreductase n=1 Tax=Flavobacterium sp. 9R TaxID=2653143 RepID=UPI0012F0D0B6|nr:SDR family oxidoreductase [Flavobacterium sp. 9R]VXA96337.1 Short chain dehydrogenase family protein [Flavobacterium sp. 9R]